MIFDRRIMLSLLNVLIIILCIPQFSHSAVCYPYGSAYTYVHDVAISSKENYPGYSTNWSELSRGGNYYLDGGCTSANAGKPTYFTFTVAPGMTNAGSDGTSVWYDVSANDYLQVSTQIYIAGTRRQFVNVPTDGPVSNLCNSTCDRNGLYGTGSRIKIRIRIKRKYVGQSFFINQVVAYAYAATSSNDAPTQPIAIIELNGSVTVPQSCSFDVGDIIEFDFGNIPTNAFAVNAGQAAKNVNIITKNVGISCKNIDAQQMLSARLEATKVQGNSVVSTNENVGFQLANKDNTVLTPNDTTSYIPFKLDDNAKSNFILKAWPVSVTGVVPTAGPVSAVGYVRIDFQ